MPTPNRSHRPPRRPNGDASQLPSAAAPLPASDRLPDAGGASPRPACAHRIPAECDAHAVEIVRQRQCEIIAACCDHAAQGSYLHAKFAFEFAGIAPAGRPDPAAEARERSLLEDLMAKLEDDDFIAQLNGEAPPA